MSWELALVGTVLGASIALFIAGGNVDKEHFPLKLFFLGVGFFLLILAVGMNYQVITANNSTINDTAVVGNLTNLNATAHKTLNYGSWMLMAYFFFYIFIAILRFFGKLPGADNVKADI